MVPVRCVYHYDPFPQAGPSSVAGLNPVPVPATAQLPHEGAAAGASRRSQPQLGYDISTAQGGGHTRAGLAQMGTGPGTGGTLSGWEGCRLAEFPVLPAPLGHREPPGGWLQAEETLAP